ncbi:cupin domain-containing protein [Saccharibacillus qingshengii]|uniref:cupin domain-containing protein n=1 Tax=Saccharibacillus qingshengii TaxID=1763540 RepID=UPI00155729D1|nr:cupin domain-containing protein [Saccharibacillus qingshengii]
MMNLLGPVTIREELDKLKEHWSPRVIGKVNNQYIKVAKVQGELVWHKHDDEDEMFLIVYGQLLIQMEDRDDIKLGPGEFYVVPRGVMHNPIAEQECGLVLIETVTTKHTGDTESPLTRSIEEQEGLR